MDLDEARKVAEAAGLGRLTEAHLRQLAQSIAANRELMRRLPRDLHWSEESALVQRLAASRRAPA